MPPADAIVVCAPELQPALSDWYVRRRSEGLVMRVIKPEATAEAMKRSIAQTASIGTTRYVVLVGDAPPVGTAQPQPNHFIPTVYRKADATAPWQAVPEMPGDYSYGDFNDDGEVNAAVGRLPVRSVSEAAALLARVLAYEDSGDFGRWRSQVDLVAGLGGFGPLIDGAIETVVGGIITGSLPGAIRTRITHAGPRSLFCPGTGCFTDTVLDNYADGSRFWVYAGHGHITQLDRVPAGPHGRPVLGVDDVARLNRSADGAAIALLLACYTGAFDAREDCLAKQMFLASGGPVAVLAGSRVTMPYGNAAAATGLIHAVFQDQSERLGDAWARTLNEMAAGSDSDTELRQRRLVIDSLATLLGGGRIDDERREHMQLYNWFGDPTMRLGHPEPVEVAAVAEATAGTATVLSGTAPIAGKVTVELHRRLGTLPKAGNVPFRLASSRGGKDEEDLRAERYRLANDTAAVRWEFDLPEAGPWQIDAVLPEGISGPFRIVVDVEGQSGYAAGSRNLWIRLPQRDAG